MPLNDSVGWKVRDQRSTIRSRSAAFSFGEPDAGPTNPVPPFRKDSNDSWISVVYYTRGLIYP